MNKFAIFILGALILAGCAGNSVPGSSKIAEPPRHFDFNQAVVAIDAAQTAIKSGNHGDAIRSLESGLALWPAHQPGWAALSRAYEMSGDTLGANFAGYFAERIEWANSLHGKTAAAAFDNIALIDKEKPFADTRIVQTAALLSAFYRQGEANIRGVQAQQLEARETFGQRYLIYPVAIATGGIVVYQLIRATGSN